MFSCLYSVCQEKNFAANMFFVNKNWVRKLTLTFSENSMDSRHKLLAVVSKLPFTCPEKCFAEKIICHKNSEHFNSEIQRIIIRILAEYFCQCCQNCLSRVQRDTLRKNIKRKCTNLLLDFRTSINLSKGTIWGLQVFCGRMSFYFGLGAFFLRVLVDFFFS